jgi:flagellar hook-associated protein 1 FlgK
MSGLFESLSSASNALVAQRMGLDVVGQNIANINTPGYTRRTLDLAEVPPTDSMDAGGGVSVVAVRALRDLLVEARLRREEGGTARDAALAEALSTVEAALGAPGASIDAEITNFFNTFSDLAIDPTSPSARDMVLRQGASVAQAFAGMVAQLGTVQKDADANIRASVDEVNRLAAELAKLNVSLATGSYDQDSIRDRQTVVLSRLSELADVAVLRRDDGGVDVTLSSGEAIVIGENAYALTTSPNGLASISLAGKDVTASLTGGRLGGLLQVRDTVIPGYVAELDQLAFDLAAAVNAVHTTGFDANGAAGGNFFTPLGSVAGAASALAVDPILAADGTKLAASASGAPGDNGIARQLAALRDATAASGGTRTLVGAWSDFVYAVGADAAGARGATASHRQVVEQLQELRAQVSGVSYDEEAAHMMRYQRAYEANARYFQTILDAMDALMEMVR